MAALIILGIPATAAAEWRHLVVRYPTAALTLALGWLAACGLCVLVRQALLVPARRRLEQAGSAADRAVGWWLSGYGRRYRRWVLDSRRYIDVKDLATGGDHTPELDDVYVDVALVHRAPHQVSGDPLNCIAEDAGGRHSVSEFLDRREPVVLAVVGPPGCGKSTLLAHAARRSARTRRRNRRRVPVLLALREHAATIASHPGASLADVLRPVVSDVPGKEPDGWWERQLRRGRCMILLDGLDEVARDEDRRALAKWVERQIRRYRDNHFVITSRPHGFPGPVIVQADILAVRPFTVEQVQLFLHRWYQAAERHATGAASKGQVRAARMRAIESASRLLTLLRANPALHDLTVNPLLLTMIATVHRYRGALPGSRADLYGEICQVMLSRRIQAKDLTELLPWPAKHKVLTTLAYEMMRRRASELPASDTVGILEPMLRRLPQTIHAQTFLEDVSRNGLLAEPSSGHYAFTHLTFQEYLAARHVSENPSLVKTLTGAVDDPWWREAILLYTATADADCIARACLVSATIPALTLAFDCADASSTLGPDLRQRLDQVRDRAFIDGCDRQHRQLIAAVLAARLARHTVTTSAGTRICDQLVPADLYWLFLQESQYPEPDWPRKPDPGLSKAATGLRGRDALHFIRWLNAITEGFVQAGFRLPKADQLMEQSVAETLTLKLPESVTSLWVQPQRDAGPPVLWVRPGQPHPHLVAADTIRNSLISDANNTNILVQILSAAAFGAAFAVLVDLERANARVADLDRELHLRFDLAVELEGALKLARQNARYLTSAIAATLRLSLDLDSAVYRALQDARACDYVLDRARVHKLDLARALDGTTEVEFALDVPRLPVGRLDLAVALSFDRALARARDHARDVVHALDLDPSFSPDPGISANGALKVCLLDITDIPLMWITDGPLGGIPLLEGMTPTGAAEIFADWMTSIAGISRAAPVEASLDGSLADALRELAICEPPNDRWDWPAGAARLADAATLMLEADHYLSASTAAGVRTVALALASGNAKDDDGPASNFKALAATVTLLQQRAQGTTRVGESIAVALV